MKGIVTALVIAGVCLMNVGANLAEWINPEPSNLKTEIYQVKSGDTFWDITQHYRAMDARDLYIFEFQDEVRELNPQLKENHCQLQPDDVITIQYVEKK